MSPSNVVLLQSDPNVARILAASLANSFRAVHLTKSIDELRHAVAKLRPYVMIVDLETASFSDVESLKQQFRTTRIICNHRVADEEMWTHTLAVGGDDCCPSSDTRGILTSALPHQPTVKSAAA